jgi:hypothetical protein
MSSFIFKNLPFDLIREILLYDNHYVIRKHDKCKLICINKIDKNDKRFIMYEKIPKILKISSNNWSINISSKNKQFIIRHLLLPTEIWEYSFITYSKDPHTNIFNHIPDSVLYPL